MDLKYPMAIILIVGLLLIGGLRSGQITGSIVADSVSPQIQLSIYYGEGNVSTYNVVLGSRDSALDALIRVAIVDYRTEGEMGAVVTGINGVKSDDEHLWLYLVNDEMPSLSCSHYYPVNGDVITFKKSPV